MCKGRLSRGKIDPCQIPFDDVFWVPSCFEALFEFQKALLKCFFFEELVLSNLIASPLMKPYFTRILIGFGYHLFHYRYSFHGPSFRHCDDNEVSLVVKFRLPHQDLI